MEQETLFTSSKWDILKCLESGKKSPNDLARESKTSVANISQQLRLLELAGFVKSERIPNRERGQPRIMYSLAGNFSYLVISAQDFVDKKFLKLDDYQMSILKIWFIEDKTVQYYVEKFFWQIEKSLEKIDFLAVEYSDTKNLKAYLITDNSELKKSIKEVEMEGIYGKKTIQTSFVKEQDLKKILNRYVILYNPNKIQLR